MYEKIVGYLKSEKHENNVTDVSPFEKRFFLDSVGRRQPK